MNTNLLKITKSHILKRFLKFGFIGAISTIINYTIFFILLNLGTNYLISSGAGYISGVLFSFIFNKRITFESKNKYTNEIFKYFSVYLINLFFSLSFLELFVKIFSINALIANVVVIGITTFLNFFGCEFLVFNEKFRIPKLFKSKIFLSILVFKIIISFFFGSDFLVKGTIPFVNYFVESGFKNPYDYFLAINQSKAFPYPPVMLYIFASARVLGSIFLPSGWNIVTPTHLFIFRLPLLIADVTIFYLLSRILKSREKLVTILYWCSPALVYINYFHGQLDVIPIALLMLSIYFIYQNKFMLSSFFLGLSIATKTHIFLILPVYLIYLWKQRIRLIEIVQNICIVVISYLIILLPFITSKGFFSLVFLAEEQFRIFNLYIMLPGGNLRLLIIPGIFLIIFLAISTFKGMNKDLYLTVIALLYSILVVFVSPMPGWYYWSLPFIVFFIAKEGRLGHFLTYILLNLFYILYEIFQRNSDIFSSFQVISLKIASLPHPYQMLLSLNLYPELLSNILITMLTFTLIIIVFWVYNIGIRNNLRYNLIDKPFIIGVCGDSSSGKTTLTQLFQDMASIHNLAIIQGDDAHKWERGNIKWNEVTHLDPKANYLYRNFRQAFSLVSGKKISRKLYDHSSGKFTEATKISPRRFIIFEGLHQFLIPRMRDIYDMKIFLDIEESLRSYWKYNRDIKKRKYTKEHLLKQLQDRNEDSKKFIKPQAKYADIVITYLPLNEIKDFTQKQKVEFQTIIKTKEYINVEDLSEKLVKTGMEFEYAFEENTFELIIKFHGKIESKDIKNIAFELIPNFHDILNNFNPVWHSDKNGVLQLVLLMYVDEKLRKNERIY